MAANFVSFLPPNYGYVFGALGASGIMNIFLTVQVAQARKKYNVQYPNLYAAPGTKFADEFNSVQRAHQNTLETYTLVMLQMALCGLIYPITSAAFGGVWVLGRIIYGLGYAGAGPKGRMAGAIVSHLGDLPLFFMTFKIAYDLIVKK